MAGRERTDQIAPLIRSPDDVGIPRSPSDAGLQDRLPNAGSAPIQAAYVPVTDALAVSMLDA